jgi:hypothetical protein
MRRVGVVELRPRHLDLLRSVSKVFLCEVEHLIDARVGVAM